MRRLTTSIALCTFNGERFLQEQLDSYIQQTRLPDEVIICDDGSTDRTIEILERWAETVPFEVRIFHNEKNLGYAQNFVKATSLCTKDIIFLSDQDDIWMPQKLDVMTRLFEEDPELLHVVSDGLIIDEDRNSHEVRCSDLDPRAKYLESVAFCGDASLENFNFRGCASAFRSSLKTYYLPIPEGWEHDIWLWLLIPFFGGKYRFIPNTFMEYRRHQNSVTGTIESLRKGMERKIAIYHWNIAEQYWAWESKIASFSERLHTFPDSPKKKEILEKIRQNHRHFPNRSRIQRSFLIFGVLWFYEIIRGGYFLHPFAWRSIFYDLRKGIGNSLRFRELRSLLRRSIRKIVPGPKK